MSGLSTDHGQHPQPRQQLIQPHGRVNLAGLASYESPVVTQGFTFRFSKGRARGTISGRVPWALGIGFRKLKPWVTIGTGRSLAGLGVYQYSS